MVIEELINKYRSNLNSTDMMIWKYIYNNKKKCRKSLQLLLKMNLLLFKYVIIQRFIDFYSDYRYSFRIMKS